MKLTYKMNEEELLAFNLFRATRKNAGTVPIAIMISCGYLAVLLVIGYMCRWPVWAYFIMVGVAVAMFFFIMWFLHNRMKRSVKIMLYRQRKDDLMPQTTLTLYDDYLEVYTVTRTSEINYSSVERVEKSKQFLYLELDENGEVGVPLRAFDNAKEEDDFLRMLVDHTPKAIHIGLTYLKDSK